MLECIGSAMMHIWKSAVGVVLFAIFIYTTHVCAYKMATLVNIAGYHAWMQFKRDGVM